MILYISSETKRCELYHHCDSDHYNTYYTDHNNAESQQELPKQKNTKHGLSLVE